MLNFTRGIWYPLKMVSLALDLGGAKGVNMECLRDSVKTALQ